MEWSEIAFYVIGTIFILFIILFIVNFFFPFFKSKTWKEIEKKARFKYNDAKAKALIEIESNRKESQRIFDKNNQLILQKRQEIEEIENKNLENKNKLEKEIEMEKKFLKKFQDNYQDKINEIKSERQKIILKLEKISNFSYEQAKKELFLQVERQEEEKLEKISKDKLNHLNSNLKNKINNILATAIERYSSAFVINNTISKIALKDDEIKGKIIGKDGRNIKTFEEESGTDIIIENESKTIKISSFNPIRREIAVNALKKLIFDGRIQPQRIKETLKIEKENIKETIEKTGNEVVKKLRIVNMKKELIYHLGMLKYRTSYGQNVLMHSFEVAKLCGIMASELGLDEQLAIRCGLLHDIGKSIDYEVNADSERGKASHVTVGVELASKYNENEIIINAIQSHHDDVPKNNIYSILVSAADTISAARPGARSHMQEDFVRRLETIEKVCNKIEGVKKTYAMKLGRVIQIIVDSMKISDRDAVKIAEHIQVKLKKELKIPGEVIVEVIREFRVRKII